MCDFIYFFKKNLKKKLDKEKLRESYGDQFQNERNRILPQKISKFHGSPIIYTKVRMRV